MAKSSRSDVSLVPIERVNEYNLAKWSQEDITFANEARKRMRGLCSRAIDLLDEILNDDGKSSQTRGEKNAELVKVKAIDLIFKYTIPDFGTLNKIQSGEVAGQVENVDKKIQLNIVTDSAQHIFNKVVDS